jgi:hypothetical protein
VTNSAPPALELRALVCARDGGAAWDLRCEVREKLVTLLQREYPQALPRFRADCQDAGDDGRSTRYSGST